jgi:hypothetical protein
LYARLTISLDKKRYDRGEVMAVATGPVGLESIVEGTAAPVTASAPAPDRHLSGPAAYWALFAIVFATFLTFFDAVTFGMLAERIKRDFGLTDSQLGFLAGPASIICYLFVGIPLARLADIYPRKYVLAGGAAVVGLIISLGGTRADIRAVRDQPGVPGRRRIGARARFLLAAGRCLSAEKADPRLRAAPVRLHRRHHARPVDRGHAGDGVGFVGAD